MLGWGAPLYGQTLPSFPAPGSPVRVTAPVLHPERQVATLVFLRSDSISVRLSDGDTVTLLRSDLTRMDNLGRVKHAKEGFELGFLSGLLVGLGGDGSYAALAFILGPLGGLAGIAVGSMIETSGWVTIESSTSVVDHVRLSRDRSILDMRSPGERRRPGQ